MAHVTPIVSDAQVEYRLSEAHGCGSHHDGSLEYRVQGMGGRQLWVGDGLAEVGLVPGGEFTEASMDAARALMGGMDPRSGEQLVAPVLRLPVEAKLPATALIDAVVGAGKEQQVTSGGVKGAAEWERLLEGARRLGDGYTVDVRLLDRVAGRAGLNLDAVYAPARVTGAREVAAGERNDVRVRGYDLTLTLPKSFSVAWALAPDGQRQAITDAYTQAAVETVGTAQEWHARAVRGHHGGGQAAEVVATSGLLGWLSVDPVNRNGDAHWHAHVTLASLGKGADGKWSALSSAGQDSLFSSVHALGALMEVRARALCAEQFGWTFRESEVTGRLEVGHVPDAAIRATSTRRADVVQALLAAGVDPLNASREEDDTAARAARVAKLEGATAMPTIVDRTRAQLEAEGVDPLLPRLPEHDDAAVLRPREAQLRAADGLPAGSWEAAVRDARARLVDPGSGPSAHAQSFTYRQALAVIATGVYGGVDRGDYELLLAAALDTPELVRLPERAGHQPAFTTRTVLDAERTVLAAARTSARRPGMPVVSEVQLQGALTGFEVRNGYPVSAEQLAVVRRIVCGGAGLDVVTGLPGTGKTTVMRVVADAYAQAGYSVGGLAVAAIAAEGLSAEAGVPAGTVAGFNRTAAPINVDVIIVDEAGMVDTRDMAGILRRAEAEGVKVIAVGDDRQLPAVGVGGWFAPARELTEGPELVDVRRQRHEHELAALRAFRAGDEQQALATFAQAGQIVVTDTRAEAVAAAARLWGEQTAGMLDPLERVESVALMAGRREDTQILNALARSHARAAGQLTGPDTSYRLMGGGELHLAVGDLVVLRRNQVPDDAGVSLRNGRRAVVEDIDVDRVVRLRWHDSTGETQRAALTPGDIVAGQLATSYLEHGNVQGAAAGTVHISQGRTVERAIAVLDPRANAATYVAMSRDRERTTLVLSAEAVAASPEDLARLRQLPAGERDAAVIAGYASALREAGVTEWEDRRLVTDRWPELRRPLDPAPPVAPADPERVAQVLAALEEAWTAQHRAETQLTRLEPRLAAAAAAHTRQQETQRALAPLHEVMTRSQSAAEQAQQAAGPAREQLESRAGELGRSLREDWNASLPGVGADASSVQAGTGRLGRGRAGMNAARTRLNAWAEQWQPVLAQLPAGLADPGRIAAGWHRPLVHAALAEHARRLLAAELPRQVELIRAAETAAQTALTASAAYHDAATLRQHSTLLSYAGWQGRAGDLPRLTEETSQARAQLQTIGQRITAITSDPAISSQPNPESFQAAARSRWAHGQRETTRADQKAAQQRDATQAAHRGQYEHSHDHVPDTRRGGPSIGR